MATKQQPGSENEMNLGSFGEKPQPTRSDFKQRKATTMNWCAAKIWNHGGWEYCDDLGTVRYGGKLWCERHHDRLVVAEKDFGSGPELTGEEAERFEKYLREERYE
jgi:hypothetical protein